MIVTTGKKKDKSFKLLMLVKDHKRKNASLHSMAIKSYEQFWL